MGITRRNFLRGGFTFVALGAVPRLVANPGDMTKYILSYFENQEKIELEIAARLQRPMTFGLALQEQPEVAFKLLQKEWAEKKHRKENLENAVGRIKPYMGNIREAFSKYGIPERLYALPIIESHFRKVRSPVGAVGEFQIMKDPARENGGIVLEGVYDERIEPVLAAEIAAKILKKGFEETGDWEIAVARYNSKNLPLGFLASVNRGDANKDLESYIRYLGKTYNVGKEEQKKYVVENAGFLARLKAFNKIFPDFAEKVKNSRPNFFVCKISENPWEYVVQEDDSFRKVAEKYFISQNYGIPLTERATERISRKIARDFKKLVPGRKISVYAPSTLYDFAYSLGIRDPKLWKINSHIYKPDARLPKGARIVMRSLATQQI